MSVAEIIVGRDPTPCLASSVPVVKLRTCDSLTNIRAHRLALTLLSFGKCEELSKQETTPVITVGFQSANSRR